MAATQAQPRGHRLGNLWRTALAGSLVLGACTLVAPQDEAPLEAATLSVPTARRPAGRPRHRSGRPAARRQAAPRRAPEVAWLPHTAARCSASDGRWHPLLWRCLCPPRHLFVEARGCVEAPPLGNLEPRCQAPPAAMSPRLRRLCAATWVQPEVVGGIA
ncbi:MAG: hypothetical protein EOO40_01745, partial [Deltaproteobacteria bacterium]